MEALGAETVAAATAAVTRLVATVQVGWWRGSLAAAIQEERVAVGRAAAMLEEVTVVASRWRRAVVKAAVMTAVAREAVMAAVVKVAAAVAAMAVGRR